MARFLDLRAFILRTRVLSLYRQALRITRRAPEHARDELRKTARAEFEKSRHCDDKQKIRFLISEGKQRLKGAVFIYILQPVLAGVAPAAWPHCRSSDSRTNKDDGNLSSPCPRTNPRAKFLAFVTSKTIKFTEAGCGDLVCVCSCSALQIVEWNVHCKTGECL
ncbi:hypothetical protein BS78_04G224100 [Paspalum vaginatum]|nr:hypothetical protein BS78_04G224100 [Paspalum vaginatum]